MLPDLKPYSRLSPDGDGIEFDIDAIAVDLITLAKAAGITHATFMFNMERIWRDVEVTVDIPGASRPEEIN